MDFKITPKASFQFKPGAVTLGDLGKMMQKGDDGKVTLSVPQDVLVESSVADSNSGISDPFGWNKSVEAAPQAEQAPPIRESVQEAIDFISSADELRVIHTTRGMRPTYPKGFPAGRYAVGARKGDQTKTFIMNTEGRVSHLGEVIPGQTQVDGYVAEVSDPYGQVAEGSKFNDSEMKALTISLMANKPDAEPTAYAAAIYSNGDQAKYTKACIEALPIE